ncbi:MAG: InlB B-repeat-containing protein [Dysgonamonadaceae bacterium]|nr:InlB B-repeat-containing protein [Dysgonamonadaceae bacterium]
MNRKIYLAAAVCLLCLSQAQAQDINTDNVIITASGTYTITGNGSATRNTITVNPGVVADITLENVNIDVSNNANACAFNIRGADVTLVLSGTNTLRSNGTAAGLQVSAGATLVIENASNSNRLTVSGGAKAAGIGGASGYAAGNITINGGIITATGSTAAGDNGGGAGIGGGYQGDGGEITAICESTAWGAAAIGGGGDQNDDDSYGGGEAGHITINGGNVTAQAGLWSAGIGSGYTPRNRNSNGIITITGGTVVAIAGSGGAIGGGSGATDGSISISSGTIIATGRGIGFGNYGSTPTTITGVPIIFATAINGTASNPGNGIASGDHVNISPTTQMVTLKTAFTVPQNALLTIPPDWMLTHFTYSLTNSSIIICYGGKFPPQLTYTVTFDMNGQGTAIAPIRYIMEGSRLAAVRPADPTSESYTFGGWYKESECTNSWNFASGTVSANTTLYAKWTLKQSQSITGFNKYYKNLRRCGICAYGKQQFGLVGKVRKQQSYSGKH